MLKGWIRNKLASLLEHPRSKVTLAKSLLKARQSLDYLAPAITNPGYDFAKDRSLYPKLAAQFAQLMSSSDTHPHYAWGSLQAVSLAQALGVERVSFIEFGVAGGKGLIALDRIALSLESMYNVAIEVYGFDAEGGLPSVSDHRDLPNLWDEGYYPMDRERLKRHLPKARLVIGDVRKTLAQFIESKPAPIGFVSFDLDLYTSTKGALRLFESDPCLLLPRVHCYFDDIMGFTAGEHNGERLAIHEFNESHEMRKVSHTYGLKYFVPEPFAHEMWTEMMFIAHMFDHPLYGRKDGLVRGSASLDPLEDGAHWTRLAR